MSELKRCPSPAGNLGHRQSGSDHEPNSAGTEEPFPDCLRPDHGVASIGPHCKGCDRCAARCPAGAISFCVDEEEALVKRLLARVEQRTDIGPS